MEKSLIVVESPTKVKTLSKYLGQGFIIKATYGHIKDLPEKRLGVDIKNGFRPEFVTIKGKGKVIEDIRRASEKVDMVLIGSDPDREGEAIAFHVKEIVDGRKNVKRVLFHEITKKGIEEGLKNITDLNEQKYNAQKARRILDRLVGYKISPILWEKVSHRLSAGRVQSAALRVICDREEEIENFVREEYYKIDAVFTVDSNGKLKATLERIDGKRVRITSEEEALKIKNELQGLQFSVGSVTKRRKEIMPQPPFTTSKMQQEASKVLKFSPQKTMILAQRLYEGVEIESGKTLGLITYMRTDSVRVSDEAREAARNLIREHFGEAYLPHVPNVFKNKKTAQDAHEAIRPTDVFIHPDSVKPYLSKDLYSLYELIWKRFVSSQMTAKIVETTSVIILGGKYEFAAKGEVLIFDGFSKLYEEKQEEAEIEERIPEIDDGSEIGLEEVIVEKKYTNPPPRYTEASLIKTLETNGIGRPSTYATIVSTIQERGYVKKEDGKLIPTPLGRTVNRLLKQFFPLIVDIDFTAKMEDNLDQIENGKKNWVKTLESFYTAFERELQIAKREMRNLKYEETPTDINCDRCGKRMLLRWSKKGHYLICEDKNGCGNRREAKVDSSGGIHLIEREIKGKCPLCSGDLIEKRGKYGRFVACSNFPSCKYTEPVSTGYPCPKENCGGKLVERVSRKKRRKFLSCSNYPDCNFVTSYEPKDGPCPNCNSPTLFVRRGRTFCLREGCNWRS